MFKGKFFCQIKSFKPKLCFFLICHYLVKMLASMTQASFTAAALHLLYIPNVTNMISQIIQCIVHLISQRILRKLTYTDPQYFGTRTQ